MRRWSISHVGSGRTPNGRKAAVRPGSLMSLEWVEVPSRERGVPTFNAKRGYAHFIWGEPIREVMRRALAA